MLRTIAHDGKQYADIAYYGLYVTSILNLKALPKKSTVRYVCHSLLHLLYRDQLCP